MNLLEVRMKKITVEDVLKLEVMKEARLVAGESGLSNEVHYINVYDNPVSQIDYSIQLFSGDIYLTFFYYGKDNDQYIQAVIQMLIAHQASALIVFDEYIQELPTSSIKFCNDGGLPVMFLDSKTPYALIISSIMEYRIAAEQKKTIEDKLTAIVSNRTSKEEKLELITDINPNFQKNVTALFLIEKDILTGKAVPVTENINLLNTINRNLLNFAAEYRNGILIILSYSDSHTASIEHSISNAIDIVRKYIPHALIGISNSTSMTELGNSISQASMAISTGSTDINGISRYDQLGITRLLLDLQGTSALESFYEDVTRPIEQADTESSANLLETMLCFAANDMDYRKTCKAMFVHENTIRYRINRIKDLIPYGKNDIDFYETISVISKIYKMKQF